MSSCFSEVSEIPPNIQQELDIKPVRWIDEVLEIALLRIPEPLPIVEAGAAVPSKDKPASEDDADVLRRH